MIHNGYVLLSGIMHLKARDVELSGHIESISDDFSPADSEAQALIWA